MDWWLIVYPLGGVVAFLRGRGWSDCDHRLARLGGRDARR
jgi:hypothetical protein